MEATPNDASKQKAGYLCFDDGAKSMPLRGAFLDEF
jgi:hypothetical protein